MDITTLLLNAQSGDPHVRSVAEKQLQAFEQQDLTTFLVTLAAELGNNDKNPQARLLAGIILKNGLDPARNEQKKLQTTQQWIAFDPNARNLIKQHVINTMASPVKEPRQIASQVLSRIALIELPNNMWPDLIQFLTNNMTHASEAVRQSTLETLGYICEDIQPPTVIEAQAGLILTAVIKGAQKEEPNNDVRLAGLRALYNALEFVKGNMEREGERNFILQVVLEATQSQDERIRVAAFECIVKIATNYYNHLSPYMQHLFNVTINAIKADTENVAQQAIEFWSSVCDEEAYLQEEAEIAAQMKKPPSQVSNNFIRGSLQFLIPVLTECLTKQDEEPDDDTWNSAMAAGTCLSLIATTVGDDILPFVWPFVESHISSPNWRYREAATLAFGSILEGPRNQQLAQVVGQVVPVLLSHLRDQNECVKDTSAWTIGRICQLHKTSIGPHFQSLVQMLCESLNDVPRVAANACWALHNLATDDDEDKPSPLSPFFTHIVQVLLKTTERDDSDENNLRCSAYEALNVLVQAASDDCLPAINMMVPVFIDRLEKTLQMQALSAAEKEAQTEAQALLCSVLTIITQRLGDGIKGYADKMMSLYLQVFGARSASVHEEALMAVGALANAMEADFDKYMQHTNLRQYLYLGLKNSEEHQVCIVAVGVVGDICRAIGPKILPYCNDLIQLLLTNLKNAQINKDVKPPILSCFGDLALAVSGNFEQYLALVMGVLQQASATTVPPDDYDLVEYLNQLREGIFEAYTGIIQGLRGDNKSHLILPYVNHIISFIAHVSMDNTRSDAVTRGAVGVMGDIGHSLGAKVKPQLQQPFAHTLIQECLRSENSATVDVAQWAQEVIAKL